MKVSALMALMENVVDSCFVDTEVSGAAVDSRKVHNGNIFFACKGENTDGNLFAQDALINGASVVVTDNSDIYGSVSGNRILVKDSIAEIKSVGRKRLETCCLVKIAVTGSFGKTGTKEMIRLVLSGIYKVYATQENYNNELGVCLTACGIPAEAEIVVMEIGSNSPGEIAALAEIIRPDIAVITGVGHAHVGRFGGIAELVKEKLSLLDHLSFRGVIVANGIFAEAVRNKGRYNQAIFFGSTPSSDIKALDCTICGMKASFNIVYKEGELPVEINYPYVHLAENFLAAFAVGKLLNVPYKNIAQSASKYEIPEGRGSVVNIGGLTVLDDTYNSSLEAVMKSIDSLDALDTLPKYALIGGINEIEGFEDYIYETLYRKAIAKKDISFMFAGEAYQKFESSGNVKIAAVSGDVEQFLNNAEKGIILIKASRGFRFEKYVNYLKKRCNNAL